LSSNTNIGNTPVNQGYVQLIHTGETGGIDGTLRTLYDGDGTASDLQIASNKVKISTQLYIGSKTITEYVQDVVGDMLDTNGSHTNITATYDDNGDGAIDLVATGAISGLTEGTGVTITGTANKTIAIGQSVGTSDSVTFGRVNLGSTDTSSFLTGDPKISATGYMMIQGIVNETETGTAPAAIVFGNNSTYGNDEISLITNGQNRLFINSSGDIAISQDLTISGDLQVNGTTTTVNQTNLDVSDNIIGLNRGVASNANDSGLIIERGSTGNNVFIGWKETNDRVLFGTTLAEADDTGDLTIADADIQANRLYGDVTGNVTGDLTGDVTGSLSGGTVTILSSPIALSDGGTGGGSAAEARTSLGVDPAGTDNSTNVTLAGSLNYITLSGQQITRNAIDLTTDVTGVLPSANLDADTAHLSGTQTFSGAKTFSSTITGSITGNAGTATALATARSITMSGEVSSGAVNFDGTAGVVIPNTTIGSGVIVNGSIASDAAIATSKLASNTISGVALGSNLNALTVGTGMAFATGSNYTGATARQITLNLSAIDHDSLGNFVEEEHIDWTIDQGATNIHAGNYTDTNTNQLTTFVIQDGDTTNVTIDQGKYVKFQALTNGGLDIDWASSLGAGSSGDPYDLQFKIDLSNMSALADTLESGDNLLVYNADEGTALAPVSEIQSALSIPSASGTTDGVVTLNANGTLTGESALTFDGSHLSIAPTGRIYLDGGSDTYIDEPSGDQLRLVAGGTEVLKGYSGGAIDMYGGSTTSRSINIGANRSGNGYSWIDLVGDASYTNFGARFIRNNGGANTSSEIIHRGTGTLALKAQDAGKIRFYTSNTERVRIDSSGNVSIGNIAPAQKLHISGNTMISNGSYYMAEDADGDDINLLGIHSNNNCYVGPSSNAWAGGAMLYGAASGTNAHVWYEGDAERMRIADNGFLGIGTASPSVELHVKDASSHAQLRIETDSASHGAYLELEGSANKYQIYNVGGDLGIDEAGVATRFIIKDSTGNVGIGTTSPSQKLHVAGSVRADTAYYVDGNIVINTDGNFEVHDTRAVTPSTDLGLKGVRFDFKANSTDGLSDGGSYHGVMTFQQWGDTSGGHIHALGFTDNGYVHHRNASIGGTFGNWKKLIQEDNSGNVGIGQVSPGYKLDVAGDARITSGSLGVGVTPNATDGRGDFSNDVVAFSTSDKRLKENIKPLDSALDKVLQISGVEFDWKELTEEEKKTIHGNQGHDVGVIAQEIEEVLPEVVTTRDSGYKAVKYEKIVPLLIEAIKEQQKQIEELKNG